jgi:hypothetical protein
VGLAIGWWSLSFVKGSWQNVVKEKEQQWDVQQRTQKVIAMVVIYIDGIPCPLQAVAPV